MEPQNRVVINLRTRSKPKMNGWAIFGISMFAVIFVLGTLSLTGVIDLSAAPTTAQEQITAAAALAGCGDTGFTALVLNIHNIENTSGVETYDAEVTFLGAESGKITGTDSTDGEYDNIVCGETYELIVESADGASGDNSKIVEILAADDDAVLTAEGTVLFTPNKPAYELRVGIPQHATLEFKMYDNDNARYAYDTGDAENSNYEGDGVVFTNGDNTSGWTLAADGDFVDMTMNIRAVQTDTEFCDMGCLVAVEAPVTEYDEPQIIFGGKQLVDISGTGLNANERKQLSDYEYVYEIDAEMTRTISQLGFYIEANADASTDVQIDFLARGKVDSINGVDIITGSAQDNSAATTVYAVMDTSLTIT